MDIKKDMFCLDYLNMKLDLAGIEPSQCIVKVSSKSLKHQIYLQHSVADKTIYTAEDFFTFIAKCNEQSTLPCVCIEQSFNGVSAYLEMVNDLDYFTDVSYSIGQDDSLVIKLEY